MVRRGSYPTCWTLTLVDSHNFVFDSYYLSPQGNYVVQQVFVCGDEAHKDAILDTMTREDSLLKFSKHKYASNVVETVLMHGQPHHKERILQEIFKVSHVMLFFEKIRCDGAQWLFHFPVPFF